MPFQIFSGVYDDFDQTGSSTEVFSTDLYLNKASQRLEAAMGGENFAADSVLPPLAATLLAERGRLSVLDFGGGPGISYLSVVETLPRADLLTFHVLDNAGICSLGRSRLIGRPGLRFIEQTSDLDNTYDLVHFGSVLQYICPPDEVISIAASKRADYILVSDAMVGSSRSFITIADYYGHKHPHMFMSFNDIESLFERHGYELSYRVPYLGFIQGRREFYDMSNLPPELRIEHTYHLVFRATERP
jgi:putative methyltransferase (TIGR04325 family)